jgi:peptide/nickel transport system substrate-binding protein
MHQLHDGGHGVRPGQAPRSAGGERPGTNLNYISFNAQDSVLRDVRVRQAIAYAMNRPLIIHSLWRDRARIGGKPVAAAALGVDRRRAAVSLRPSEGQRTAGCGGLEAGKDGIRFRLAMKTSTDETSRLLAMILQQQLRDVGIALEVRSFEFATFFSDISKGAFQMYTLRWLGGNEDPDIFHYAYDSRMFPPHGANRGRYVNAALDALIQGSGHVGRPGAAPQGLCEGAADSRRRVAVD